MRTYDPPVKDYAFLLRHVIDAEKVLEEVTGGTVGLEDAIDVIEGAGAVVAPIAALNAIGDEIGAKLIDGEVVTPPGFKDAFASYAEGGWIGLSLPESIGGAGMPRVLGAAADEFLHGANPAFAMACGLGSYASWVFAQVDDPELRSTYAARLLSGEWSGTMDLSEPQAGTDLAAIRTIARPQADGTWKVSGQKIFISWGDHDLTENVVHLVLARTPDAPPGVGGLSLFVVPKFLPLADGTLGERNAVNCVSLERKLGLRASPTCVMDYDGATGFLVGEQHRGLRAMFIMMNAARMASGIQGLGVAELAFQKARAYAGERVQGRVIGREPGTPIAEHPDVRRLLLSMASALTAMRALAVQTAAWLDLSDPLGQMFLPVLKGWLTETGVEIASDAIQVHGGTGYVEETGVAQQLRDARIMPIFEGTTAVQANHLVSRLLARDSGA
ncbi:MAG TPA: acyl-CoA dehydrogenase family protein, partial [Vicinamibacterales bacterium]|nr:acyl-CoA dehydrogenase family protein [Vicinamibacterales bacterium]